MIVIIQAIHPGNKDQIPIESQKGTSRFSDEIINDIDEGIIYDFSLIFLLGGNKRLLIRKIKM